MSILGTLIVLLLGIGQTSAAYEIGNFTSIYDAIPQILDLPLLPPTHPGLGRMNLTNCCLLAVKSAFTVENGFLVITNQSFLSADTTVDSFLDDTHNERFPCGTPYDNNPRGNSLVKASYPWCAQNCPGWQRTDSKKFQKWLGPIVSYILPSLVFSMSIPRRRKLEITSQWIRQRSHSFLYHALAPVQFIIAVVVVVVDAFIWLSLCFAFSGPMILSGILEVYLDSQILSYVIRETSKKLTRITDTTKKLRRLIQPSEVLDRVMGTRLLYIILVGNLDFGHKSREEALEGQNRGDPWDDLENLLQDPKSWGRLGSMLEIQNGYGLIVGVPVTFFSGAFLYSLWDVKQSLGNNDVAHALAFGMWWIIVPHMAIISSFLLAGNNPSIFQAVAGTPNIEHYPYLGLFALAYKSSYKPEWLWFRGRSKLLWIKRLLLVRRKHNSTHLHALESALNLSARSWTSLWVWFIMIALATVLILVPATLAFLTSFFTPQVGLSCRSMTFLLYFISQLGQICLWVWMLSGSTVDTQGRTHSPAHVPRSGWFNHLRFAVYWIFVSLFAAMSVFSAIGGTLMQLLGVYSNCLCALPIQNWSSRYDASASAYVSLGVNTADDIASADIWWFLLGSIATGFLCVATFSGWWYQQHLRGKFREAVKGVRRLEFS